MISFYMIKGVCSDYTKIKNKKASLNQCNALFHYVKVFFKM